LPSFEGRFPPLIPNHPPPHLVTATFLPTIGWVAGSFPWGCELRSVMTTLASAFLSSCPFRGLPLSLSAEGHVVPPSRFSGAGFFLFLFYIRSALFRAGFLRRVVSFCFDSFSSSRYLPCFYESILRCLCPFFLSCPLTPRFPKALTPAFPVLKQLLPVRVPVKCSLLDLLCGFWCVFGVRVFVFWFFWLFFLFFFLFFCPRCGLFRQAVAYSIAAALPCPGTVA